MADRTLTVSFEDQYDFTFDSDIIEVISDVAKLKDLRPTYATFYDSFTGASNANWGGGTLTRTLAGGATISGDELICTGFDGKYASYSATDNGDSAQTGCIRVRFKPGYTGNPASTNSIVSIVDSGLNNLIRLTHSNAGNVELFMADYTGGLILSVVFGSWSPVASTYYEFELNYDITNGATSLFINGVQLGTTRSGSGTRLSSGITNILLGTSYQGTELTNNTYSHLLIFSTVQHTANYTPSAWGNVSETIYDITVPKIYNDTILRHQGITSLANVVSVSGSDLVYYTISKDGTEYYYDTVNEEWAITTGYPDVNTLAEINANVDTLITDGLGVSSYINVYLYSDDGSTTPEITSYTVVYDFYGAAIDDATLCTLYGYVRDNGTVLSGATVTISPSLTVADYGDDSSEVLKTYKKTTDANGYWEQDLVETTNMDVTYDITVHYVYSDGTVYHREFNNIVIPNQDNVNVAELI